MESTHRLDKQTCHKCDRLALTFDENDTPLCGRHATIFIAISRVETKDDGHWITVNVEASV
jgi:hypothetical protein